QILDLENLEEVGAGLLPGLGAVAGDLLDLVGDGLGVVVVVGADDDLVDDVLLVQQRLGAVDQHVGAGVIDRGDAGLEDADDPGGGAAAGGAGEGDRVVEVGPDHVGDPAAEDHAVGGRPQPREAAGDQVLADRRHLY